MPKQTSKSTITLYNEASGTYTMSILNANEIFQRAEMENTLLTIDDKIYAYDDIISIHIVYLPNIDNIHDLPHKLQELYITNTTLNSLVIPQECRHLRVISIKESNLTAIPEIGFLPNLTSLIIECGNIRQTVDEYPRSLVNINLSYNRLSNENCNLRSFPQGIPIVLFNNCFTNKEQIEGYIFCFGTQRSSTYIRRDQTNYDIHLNQHRNIFQENLRPIRPDFHALFGGPLEPPRPQKPEDMFQSGQTVHISSICKSVTESVQRVKDLTKDVYNDNIKHMLIDQLLNQCYGDKGKNIITKILRYFKPVYSNKQMVTYIKDWVADVAQHSASKTKYDEMLARIWILIDNHAQKEDFINNLKIELESSVRVCFTGRFNRLINSLVGFVDGITVGISLKEQLQIEINRIIEKLGQEKITYAECKKQMEDILNAEEVIEDKTITEEWKRSWLDALEDYNPDKVEEEEEYDKDTWQNNFVDKVKNSSTMKNAPEPSAPFLDDDVQIIPMPEPSAPLLEDVDNIDLS